MDAPTQEGVKAMRLSPGVHIKTTMDVDPASHTDAQPISCKANRRGPVDVDHQGTKRQHQPTGGQTRGSKSNVTVYMTVHLQHSKNRPADSAGLEAQCDSSYSYHIDPVDHVANTMTLPSFLDMNRQPWTLAPQGWAAGHSPCGGRWMQVPLLPSWDRGALCGVWGTSHNFFYQKKRSKPCRAESVGELAPKGKNGERSARIIF